MRHRFAKATGRNFLPAVFVALIVAAVASLGAQSASKYSTDPPAGWKVPRTADGKPDLQGVWGNNGVTPMTRPTQWKNKEFLTDAELTELQTVVARQASDGGDAIFGDIIQLA